MQPTTSIYFKDGNIVSKHGEATVYEMSDELFLEVGPGHNLWALESEYFVYMEQLGDKPRGKCLEIGLGLGIASRCILTYPQVVSLTTVELRKDVIATHRDCIDILDTRYNKWALYDSEKHFIVNQDGLRYMIRTKNKYDFIFMDFYKHIDEDTLPEIEDMVAAATFCLNEGGTILGWLDPHTPVEFYNKFNKLFKGVR